MNCISDFAFLPVYCFQSFSCAKKRHESNKSVEIVHEFQFLTAYYRNTNDVSTHAWPWLYFTVHRHDIVRLLFFVVQDHVVKKIRYTSFMSASENDHSNFFIYRYIGCDQKRCLQKFIIHISSQIIFSFKWLFLDQLNLIWIPIVSFSQNSSILPISHHQR